jgi:ketosteroid isomerase-like protein
VRRNLGDDFHIVEHRPPPSLYGSAPGPDGFIALLKTLFSTTASAHVWIPTVHAVDHGVGVFETRTRALLADGGQAENVIYNVCAMSDGRIVDQEMYGDGQLAEALARFEHRVRGGAAQSRPLDNDAVRWAARATECFERRDWAGLESITAPGAQWVSRRLVGASSTVVVAFRSYADAGFARIDLDVLATRGDLLALLAVRIANHDSYVDQLVIVELEGSGQMAGGFSVDEDQLDAAMEELDARYLGGQGAAHAGTLEPALSAWAPLNRLDGPGIRRWLSDDFVVVDHRPPPTVYGSVDGPDGFVSALLTYAELTSSVRFRLESVDALGDGAMVVGARTVAVLRDGGHTENVWKATFAADFGRLTRVEFFAEDQLDQATSRFRALVSDPADREALRQESFASLQRAVVTAQEQSEAWAPIRGLTQAYNRRDWDGLLATMAEDCVVVDERMTGWGTIDRATFVERIKELFTIAPDAELSAETVYSVSAAGIAGRFRVTGTVPGGGEFSMFFEVAGNVRDGVFGCIALLPEGQVEEAMQRLTGPPAPAKP